MACGRISDAKVGSAPGLEIRQRLDRPSSEGGESVHSVALTTLSSKRLDGIPISQKVGEKVFLYFDRDGNQLTKQQAMSLASGVIYYPEVEDPSKGRLRHHGLFVSENDARTIVSHSVALTTLSSKRLDGIPIAQKVGEKVFHYLDKDRNTLTKQQAMALAGGVVYYPEVEDPSHGRFRHHGLFVSENDARTIVSGSRAGSDVANIDDLDGLDGNLHSVDEEGEEAQQGKAETVIQTGKTGHSRFLPRLFVFVLLAAISLPRLWPEGRREIVLTSSVGYVDNSSTLSPEIAALLKSETMP